jgi:hypothetical protein
MDSAIESSLVEELSSSKAAGDGQHVPKEGTSAAAMNL